MKVNTHQVSIHIETAHDGERWTAEATAQNSETDEVIGQAHYHTLDEKAARTLWLSALRTLVDDLEER